MKKKIPIMCMAFLLAVSLAPAQPVGAAEGPSQGATRKCVLMSGPEALASAIHQVPAPGKNYRWDPAKADFTGYNPCRPFSWIVLRVAGATGSSPQQIMFFYRGEFVGRATKQAFGFSPTINRIATNKIKVTFTWAQNNEPNAKASGKAESVYTLMPASKTVRHSGQLPPGVEPVYTE
jgi:hypothetical protein